MKVKKALIFAAIAMVFLCCDLYLKAYIHRHIPMICSSLPIYPYGGIGVFKDWHGIDFSIVHVANKGAAWGAFSSLQHYLLYARVAIIGGLFTYLFFVKSSDYRKFSLTLVLSGAVGNVCDFFVYGHVVDMFYFKFWNYSYPVFNIADSLIFSGILLLAIETLLSKFRNQNRQKLNS